MKIRIFNDTAAITRAMRLITTIACSLSIVSCPIAPFGCAAHGQTDDIRPTISVAITQGIGFDELQENLKPYSPQRYAFDDEAATEAERIAAERAPVFYHEFSTFLDDNAIHCYSANLLGADYSLQFYFLFRDDKLWKVVEPPPFTLDVARKGLVRFAGSSTPRERVMRILESHGIPWNEFRILVVDRWQLAERSRKKHTESLPLLARVIAAAGAGEAERKNAERATERFDVLEKYRMSDRLLGSNIETFQNAMGEPSNRVQLQNGNTLYVYTTTVESIGTHWPPLIAVVFSAEQERAVAVYARDFFDDMRLTTLIGE